jgi:uncharacterized protein YjiS (DUF1127 family)
LFVKGDAQAHFHVINIVTSSGEIPMADISLHYSSKAPLAGTYTAFANVLQLWRRRSHDRQELAKLDPRSLRDLGLSEGAARFEANKPFWRE